MTFGRTLKKALNRNNFPTEFSAWSAFARDRPRRRLLTHSTPTHSPPTPSSPMPSLLAHSSLTPKQPPVNTAPFSPATGTSPLPKYPRLGTRPSPERKIPNRKRPIATPDLLPASTAPVLHYRRTILRKVQRSATNAEDRSLQTAPGRFKLDCQRFVAKIYCDEQYCKYFCWVVIRNKRGN